MTASEPPHRLIGGRYRIERSIGAGGMGNVWAGRDELLDRAVAIKEVRFPDGLGRPEQDDLRERTLREARATARLSHPNVVTTYDVVEEDGRPWIVMELLPSRSLSTLLREDGPMPPHKVAELGLAMLGALEVSHQQGIVHRDVKPGNVLITPDGRPVLTDFGIATMAGDPSLTSTGVVLGSPAYMSPERARGLRPGPEADMWSLGATLYAAVEGRPPYDADNALGTLTAVISDPVEPPEADGPLREAILGLLEKDPAARLEIDATRELLTRAAADHSAGPQPTAAAGAVALDRASRTEALAVDPPAQRLATPPPSPPPPGYREYGGRPPGRRGPSGLGAAAAVIVLLLLGLVVVGALALRGDNQNPPDSSGAKTTTSAPASTPGTPSTATTAATENDSPKASASAPDSGTAPAGFRTYRDESGFSLAVPDDWQPTRSGTQVKFQDPSSLRYLLIDQTDQPKQDPKQDWEEQEKSFAPSHRNYQRISIESVPYRDYPAADWRYTWATQTQAVNRGFVAGDKGYALYVSGPRSTWAESEAVFEQAAKTFQPAG
jgi:serine/threonine protein kinase